jgi:hypothetical protein
MLDYNSMVLKKYKAYTIADEEISIQDVICVGRKASVSFEPKLPVPQANSFPRILDLL